MADGHLLEGLVALGLVEPLELFQHIAEQVREKLLDLFTWESGTATFYEGVDPPSSGFPLRLDAWEILDRGIQRRIAAGFESELIMARRTPSWARTEKSPPTRKRASRWARSGYWASAGPSPGT